MDLLVISSNSDAAPATESLRRLVRRLHLGTEVRVSTVMFRAGERHRMWDLSSSATIVVDDLRTWLPAQLLDRVSPWAGGKLRGARLRMQLRKIPRPDVILLDGPEAPSLLPKVSEGTERVLLRERNDAAPTGAPTEATVAQLLAFGFDGTAARTAALDTRRDSRRIELGLDGFTVVAAGTWSIKEFDSLTVLLGTTDSDTVCLRAADLDRPDDIVTADVVITRSPAVIEDAAIRDAVFGGTPVVAIGPVAHSQRDWFDAVLRDGDGLDAAVLAARAMPHPRDERMRDAYRRFDVEVVAERFESLLEEIRSGPSDVDPSWCLELR